MSLQKKKGVVLFQPDRVLIAKQVQKFAPYLSGTVLDVGSGSFRRYERFLVCEKYLTLDPNPNSGADIISPAEKIQLADASVDSIISTQTLEHVVDPWAVVSEFSRIIKPEGYCLVTVPLWGNLHEEPVDFWRYTKYGLTSLFERAGFSVIVIDQRGGFFTTSAQMWIRYFIDRLSLYDSFFWRIWNIFFRVIGMTGIWLDRIDQSHANRTHAIGWCMVARKL